MFLNVVGGGVLFCNEHRLNFTFIIWFLDLKKKSEINYLLKKLSIFQK